jgi:ion channel-forming bestrophin family protein
MYVRHGIRLAHLLQNSWRFLVFAWLWSTLIVYLHEFAGFTAIEIPILPVTTIGIAVSLYLGFKSTSSYNRWWEARTIWGAIIIDSRNWANHVCNLIYAEDIESNAELIRELIDRHLAWVNALAYQLRRSSCHKDSRTTHAFGHRRVFDDKDFHQVAESYRRFLSEEEIGLVEHRANPAVHILRCQGDRLRQILRDGYLDSYRQVQMMSIIGNLYASQGKCERIKSTPFPRQIANFGQIFTWFFIILLPFAFVGASKAQGMILRSLTCFLTNICSLWFLLRC